MPRTGLKHYVRLTERGHVAKSVGTTKRLHTTCGRHRAATIWLLHSESLRWWLTDDESPTRDRTTLLQADVLQTSDHPTSHPTICLRPPPSPSSQLPFVQITDPPKLSRYPSLPHRPHPTPSSRIVEQQQRYYPPEPGRQL